jgi:hypothetical protein
MRFILFTALVMMPASILATAYDIEKDCIAFYLTGTYFTTTCYERDEHGNMVNPDAEGNGDLVTADMNLKNCISSQDQKLYVNILPCKKLL